jgi:NADH-quinone oxidoreductase subunit M
MFGKLDNPANQGLADMNARELVTLVPLIVVAFWIGLYPAPFFRPLEKPVNKLVEIVQPGFTQGTPQREAKAAETPATPAGAQR